MRRPEQSGRAMEKNKGRGEGGGGLSYTWTRLEEAAERAACCRDGLEAPSAPRKAEPRPSRLVPLPVRVPVSPQSFILSGQATPPGANLARSCSTNDVTEPERHF